MRSNEPAGAATRELREQLKAVRREEQRANRDYRDPLMRGRVVTSARNSEGHRKQFLRMLSITHLDLDTAVNCISHTSHPPPWSVLHPTPRRALLEEVMAQHTAVEVAARADPENGANRGALFYL